MGRNKFFAVIDTNVLVSAILSSNPKSNPTLVLNAVFNEQITPIYNQEKHLS